MLRFIIFAWSKMQQQLNIRELFISFYESLHRYAFTILKDSDQAKDVVHNVFLHLLEQRNSGINTSIKAYLYRAVYNECINTIKKSGNDNKHHQRILRESEEQDVPDYYTHETLNDMRRRIDSVLEQLPPQCREVFIRSRGGQMKYAEIARELNISVKTVEAHMSKALKLIKTVVRVNSIIICLIYCEPFL